MVSYKNIVFDMGRVLADYDANRATEKYTDDPAIIREVNLVVYHSGEWTLLDGGLISDEEALKNMLRRCSSDEVCRAAEFSFRHWDDFNLWQHPGMDRVIADLKQAGKGLYILSNVSLRMAVNDRWREYVPYPDDFDGVFLSAEYKMLKPQPIIYETFCNRYGLKAEDCLFIDDLKRNIDAAKACGMGGIVFDGDAEKLRKDLLGTDDRK